MGIRRRRIGWAFIASLIFCPILFTGCFTGFSGVVGALPEWVAAPPQDTQKELIGVGEGFSLMRAKASALNDIAGKLGTHVSSLVDREVRQYGDQVKARGRQLITTRVNNIKLIHPRVLKSAEFDGNYYVLLAFSREKMLRDTRSRLEDLDQRLKQQWEGLGSLSPLQQFIRSKKLYSKIDHASGLAISLQVLDHGFVSHSYLERYNLYRQKSDELLRGTHFRILSTKIMRSVALRLAELLSREEIQSSVGRKHSGKNPVIEVKGELRKDLVFGTKFSHLTTILEVKDGSGNTIARSEHKATGKSLNNHEAATQDAVETLMKRWSQQSVLDVIAINM